MRMMSSSARGGLTSGAPCALASAPAPAGPAMRRSTKKKHAMQRLAKNTKKARRVVGRPLFILLKLKEMCEYKIEKEDGGRRLEGDREEEKTK